MDGYDDIAHDDEPDQIVCTGCGNSFDKDLDECPHGGPHIEPIEMMVGHVEWTVYPNGDVVKYRLWNN